MAPSFVELFMELKLEALSCICLFLVPVFLGFLLRGRAKGKLPPGPTRLPFIGNIHQLGKSPHHSLLRLSRKHGPLMYLQLGSMPMVVVSSAEMAREFFKTHDLAFSSRPALAAPRRVFYGGLDIGFAPYGDYWRQVRKIVTLEFFTPKRLEMQTPVREEETRILVRTIRDLSSSGPVNLTEIIFCYFIKIACRNVLGTSSSKEGECGKSKFEELIRETLDLLDAAWVGDWLPSFYWVDTFTGLKKRLDRTTREMDQFLEKEIESQLIQSPVAPNTSFINSLSQLRKDPSLGIPLSNENIKAILLSMALGGTDTGMVIVDRGMDELVRNPRVMKKAQDELLRVMKGRAVVEQSDLMHLEYLKQVVKETLRLHPPVPLIIRESREECTVDGFVIPAKTRVIINAFAIGRDPSCWNDPQEFWPERFEDSAIDYKGQHFELIPFGGGRRICLGLTSGITTVQLALANLLHCFNWDLPEGTKDDINMTENFGLFTHSMSRLILRATPKH